MFRNLPKELEEAALIDGCGIVRTFYNVMLPNAKSAVVTVMLFSFVWQWNDVFYSQLLISTQYLDLLSLNIAEIAPRLTYILYQLGIIANQHAFLYSMKLQRFKHFLRLKMVLSGQRKNAMN